MNDLSEKIFPRVERRGLLRRTWGAILRRRLIVGLVVMTGVGFLGGLLYSGTRGDMFPRPIGTAHLTDRAGDVKTDFKDLPPLGLAGDGLDIQTVDMTSNGRDLTLSLTLLNRPTPEANMAVGEWVYTIEFLSGERLLYTARIIVPSKGAPTLVLRDNDLLKDTERALHLYRKGNCLRPESDQQACNRAILPLVRKSNLDDAGNAKLQGRRLTVHLDLRALPKLLWGMSWSVRANGFIERGQAVTPHEDRAPDQGTADFPALN